MSKPEDAADRHSNIPRVRPEPPKAEKPVPLSMPKPSQPASKPEAMIPKPLKDSDLMYSIGSGHKDAEFMQQLADTQCRKDLGDTVKTGDFAKPVSEMYAPTPPKDYSLLMESARRKSGTATYSEKLIPRLGSAHENPKDAKKPTRDRK